MRINRAVQDTPVTGIGSSFAAGKVITVDMGVFPAGKAFRGYVALITAQISSIASSAATLTLRICRDATGDEMVVSDVDNTMSTGITTATDGTAQWNLGTYVGLASGDDLHCFLKTDTGTVTCDFLEIMWSPKALGGD